MSALYEDQPLNAGIGAAADSMERATYEALKGGAEAAEAAADTQPTALTLDQLAEDTLNRVAAFVGECVGGDTFCGFSVDEVRDENGLLLSLQLVPCDTVNGEPVRRVGR